MIDRFAKPAPAHYPWILFGLLFWSMATGFMPVATGFAMLMGMRTLVAAGESTC